MELKSKSRRDAWSYYRKNSKYKLEHKEYLRVLNALIQAFVDDLAELLIVKLPQGLGVLRIIEKVYTPTVGKDGKITGLPPIDWGSTIKLWEKDEEAKKEKLLLRYKRNIFHIVEYSKAGCTFKNKSVFTFFPSKRMRIYISNKLK